MRNQLGLGARRGLPCDHKQTRGFVTWKERKLFTAGSTVNAGFYFNCEKLDLIAVGSREGRLPEGEGDCYVRIPAVAALLLAPILGALFIVIAPGIRLRWVFYRLGRLASPTVRLVSRRFARLLPARRRSLPQSASEAGDDAASAPPDTRSPNEPGPKA
jgi:hypothetical protein